ncbi:Small auxin up regulated protein [Heracleum sosnowskyi]|uniref:Small auxin up regulated protein n=1 Tax=Heracleum sosnowskyi TaxID=360622 RepID=A0AAD8MYJ1_9APIA|nr:Small auxin up regulated protein [Heracleum sosnowskyi]
MVKLFIRLLQRSLNLHNIDIDKEHSNKEKLPHDVKEGHFAVFAAKGEVPKRFVVNLRCLTSAAFLRLLEQAEEEYGFQQKGVLKIPCKAEELEKILQDSKEI